MDFCSVFLKEKKKKKETRVTRRFSRSNLLIATAPAEYWIGRKFWGEEDTGIKISIVHRRYQASDTRTLIMENVEERELFGMTNEASISGIFREYSRRNLDAAKLSCTEYEILYLFQGLENTLYDEVSAH